MVLGLVSGCAEIPKNSKSISDPCRTRTVTQREGSSTQRPSPGDRRAVRRIGIIDYSLLTGREFEVSGWCGLEREAERPPSGALSSVA